jgi:hypothetical protein
VCQVPKEVILMAQKRILVVLSCTHNKAVIENASEPGELGYCDTCKTTKVIVRKF